jgi:hypothetical protein
VRLERVLIPLAMLNLAVLLLEGLYQIVRTLLGL